MSNVQPLTPYEPTTAVVLANLAATATPINPTSSAYSATTPTQVLPGFGAVKQLPDNILTTLASQQAVTNGNLSSSEKLQFGIVDGSAGVTLSQLSMPGQPIKPGAGEFIQQLRLAAPNYPFVKAATPVLMSGSSGINNPESLIQNTPAQLTAVTNSIQNATVELTTNGIITGKEDPTQVSGVIMAASTLGVSTITTLLANPNSVESSIASSSIVANQIAGGNFAAGLADKISNGVGGVATSIGSLSSSLVSSISSGVSTITGGLSSTMQSAFNIAEKSFGSLKAGVVNTLGGLPATIEVTESNTATILREHEIATEELIEAEKELGQAKKAYSVEESQETYSALRLAESRLALAQQKLTQTSNKLISGRAEQSNNALFGGIGAQTITTLSAAAVSGILNTPNSTNTGINALPGGLGAFANTLGSAASNVFSTIKSTASNLSNNFSGALSALSSPGNLVGNLVTNVQDKLGGISDGIKLSFNNLSSVASTTLDNAKAAYGAITNSSTANIGGVGSSIQSTLSSLGNMPGQIKSAILASNTFTETKTVVDAITNKTLDPKVPPPVFGEQIINVSPDKVQEAQVAAQQTLNSLLSQREFAAYNINLLVEKFIESNQATTIDEIEAARKNLAVIDVQIAAAQKTYDRTVRA